MTIGMIVFGSVCLGEWSTTLLETAKTLGLAALENAEYLHCHTLHMRALIGYMALFTIATVLSVYKPWELKELAAQQGRLWSI